MTHKVDLVMDFQYGSTGKGLIAGWLALREYYDTVMCAFATNAGHTYVNAQQDIHLMTQQLPTGAVVSPTVKTVLLGPGSLIHAQTLWNEIQQNEKALQGKRILIHPYAAVVENYHAGQEQKMGLLKIGSTGKGVGAAMIERIQRDPTCPNVACHRFLPWAEGVEGALSDYVATKDEYDNAIFSAENVLIEGAQGYSLSLYHGQYPYTTSRDVTPWQILADVGAPFRWAGKVSVIGTCRTYPIRVNNRDGSSGPCYPDQKEIDWDDIKVAAELTTVTKLKRRLFTFSQQQIQEAAMRCGGYWDTKIFLNFANYCQSEAELDEIITKIESGYHGNWNPPYVAWIGWGPDDVDVVSRPLSASSGR